MSRLTCSAEKSTKDCGSILDLLHISEVYFSQNSSSDFAFWTNGSTLNFVMFVLFIVYSDQLV